MTPMTIQVLAHSLSASSVIGSSLMIAGYREPSMGGNPQLFQENNLRLICKANSGNQEGMPDKHLTTFPYEDRFLEPKRCC